MEFLVDCKSHPWQKQLGYCVCVHVLEGAPVAHHIEPSAWELGEILCIDCELTAGQNINDFKLMCQSCALEKLFSRMPS